MLKNLQIRNFKSWKDTGQIELAPITVFFGANSAGKTSLLQFLLMLKQSSESSDRNRVLNLGDAHAHVDLGSFEDLIFDHDPSHRLEFSFSWDLPQPLPFVNALRREDASIDGISFQAEIQQIDEQPTLASFGYRCNLTQGSIAGFAFQQQDGQGGSAGYRVSTDGYDLIPVKDNHPLLPPSTRFYGFPDEVFASYQNAGITSDLELELERQLRRIHYLGPLRDFPRRIYSWAGEVPEHVKSSGEGTISALLAGAQRSLSAKDGDSVPFQQMIAQWLKKLGLLDSFTTQRIGQHRRDYEIRVRTPGSSRDVDLTDVGFGVSQVLPIVVDAFYVPPHSTVIVEQPELHLHPRIQAELADLFVEAAQSKEDGKDRAVQFIIESHSEHFLQRLQRRIAEQEIAQKDVAVYFCEAGPQGSTLEKLHMNSFGEIENWPDDFFGDPMTDLSARLNAAARRGKE